MSLPDLHSTRERLRQGRGDASAELRAAEAAARSPANAHVFLKTRFDAAAAEAAQAGPQAPLAGLPISIKDLFDFAGEVTTAGSVALDHAEPARADALAVARLRAAGGAVVGRTNMSEFAFSGVGTNPHHGTPPNPADARVARIPGGSSSGAAVSVATGAAFIGLGSDTGGSIRIPAALCGIVGFKNTARLTPLAGAYPLSWTLDTVCAMTRSVRDAVLAHEILAASQVARDARPLAAYRLAVATTQMLDGIDATVAAAFQRTLGRLHDAGARIEEIPLAQIRDLGTIQSTEVIKLILGIGEPLTGKLLLYDALAMSTQTVNLRKNPHCIVCGEHPAITRLIDYEEFCGVPAQNENLGLVGEGRDVEPQEVAAWQARGGPFHFLDVRDPVEQQVSALPGALNIPIERLGHRLDELDREQNYVVFCRTGVRSARGVHLMLDSGFEHVYNLAGGINAWAEQVDQSMYRY